MCKDNIKIDELVAEIDCFFKTGGSHMNIEFDKENSYSKIKETKYNECCEGQNACGIPTEFFDDEEDT